jgi:cell division protein FtsB
MALAKSNAAIIVSVIVALAGTGVYEAHQASILKTQVRSLQQERNDATNQLAALRDQNRQLSEHQAALQKTVQELQRVASVTAALDPKAAAAAAREKAEQAKVTALADGQDFLASYSQARGMLTEIGKAQIGRNYAAFYRMAGLSASQIEEFEKQTNARWMASMAVTPPSSVHPDQPELTDEQARNVLGEQAFAQFQLFKRLRPVQGMVYDMSSLSPNEPFTQDQMVQVLGILANACTSFQSGGNADPQAIDWSQVDTHAQGVLSETQIAALRAESKLPQVGKLIKEYYQNQTPAK